MSASSCQEPGCGLAVPLLAPVIATTVPRIGSSLVVVLLISVVDTGPGAAIPPFRSRRYGAVVPPAGNNRTAARVERNRFNFGGIHG